MLKPLFKGGYKKTEVNSDTENKLFADGTGVVGWERRMEGIRKYQLVVTNIKTSNKLSSGEDGKQPTMLKNI